MMKGKGLIMSGVDISCQLGGNRIWGFYFLFFVFFNEAISLFHSHTNLWIVYCV